MSCTRTATTTSADSSAFVVTIPSGLPRPHGISHTSFIVYLPDLRIKVTVAFGNFAASGQLVRLIRLGIRFLSVRSVTTRNLQVAMGFGGNYAPRGLSPQMYDMPVIPKKELHFHVTPWFSTVGVKGFEPSTPCSQSRCANRTALHPETLLPIVGGTSQNRCKGTPFQCLFQMETKKSSMHACHFNINHDFIPV